MEQNTEQQENINNDATSRESKKIKVAIFILAVPFLFFWAVSIAPTWHVWIDSIALGLPIFDTPFSFYLFIYVLPLHLLIIAIPVYSYVRRHFIFAVAYMGAVLIGFLIFGGSYRDLVLERIGITPIVIAPPGVFTIDKKSIPNEYYFDNRNMNGEYFEDYFFPKPENSDSSIIRIINYFEKKECPAFKDKEYTVGSCKAGECVMMISYGKKMALDQGGRLREDRSKDVFYEIKDHGSCVRMEFIFPDEKNALSENQIENIVNSIKREL